MIRDNGRPFRHHEPDPRGKDPRPVQHAVVQPVADLPRAEAVLATDEQRQVGLELTLGRGEQSHQTAEVVEVTMAQHQRIDRRRIDAKDPEIR